MSPDPSAWKKLTALVRSAPTDTDVAAPYGFSTRVVARAFAAQTATSSVFAKVSLRALAVAALIAVVTAATSLKPVLNTMADDVATLSDPNTDPGDVSA